ncbi:MAG: ABC transporter permease subunit [Hyphomicrobiales bacterium]|nr:ABC transporter permease subunit [Hyphomicrobiales bacterium]
MIAKRVTFKRTGLPLALLAPQLAVTVVFFLWPTFVALKQSLYSSDAFGLREVFSGLANYRALLLHGNYPATLERSAFFAGSVTAISLVLGLVLAVMADSLGRSGRIWQALLVWPYALAPAVAGVLWAYMFDPAIGPITHALAFIGIDWNHVLNSGQAMTLIVMSAAMKQVAYNFLFYLAALQAIPKSLMEAAALDAAGPVRRLFSLIIPLIAPTTLFLLVVDLTYAFFDTFGLIDSTTYGGPGNSTTIMVYQVYKDGFIDQRFGPAAAQSMMLLLLVGALTMVQFTLVERRIDY